MVSEFELKQKCLLERLGKRKEVPKDLLRLGDPEDFSSKGASPLQSRRQAFQRIELSRLGDSQMGEYFIKQLKRLQRAKQKAESRHSIQPDHSRKSGRGAKTSMDNLSEHSARQATDFANSSKYRSQTSIGDYVVDN
jgi:hypothetical protein